MLASREAYSVSSLAALREVGSLKSNMTKSQAEAVLGSLVAKGWLLKSKLSEPPRILPRCLGAETSPRRARYSLSTRALLELLPYLKSNYPEECLECTICMEVGFIFMLALLDFVSTDLRSSHVVLVAILPTAKRESIFIALENFVPVARNVPVVGRTGHQMPRTSSL